MKKLFAIFALIFGLSFFTACSSEPLEKYTVTFVQDGQPDIVRTVEEGKGLSLSEIPIPVAKTGYTVSWEEVDLSKITINIVVRAQYSPNN